MKEEKNNIKEKPITIDDIQKIDASTISKIILIDGTILIVQNDFSINKENFKKINQNNDNGATFNLKLNQIPNSNKKQKNSFSYIEWDFPNSKLKNHSFQRNIDNLDKELIESKTELNENNNNAKDNSRDSAINRSRKNKNYSFFESKHTTTKIIENNNNNTNSIVNLNHKNIIINNNVNNNISGNKNDNSGFIKNDDNYNFKEINHKSDNHIENKEKEENKNNNVINKDNNENVNNKIEEFSNKKSTKDNMSFQEKIKMIKYGLLDYDYKPNNSGLNNEENNIQKINKVKPLNLIIDKSKNKDDDINEQFNKLVNKFNEIKNINKKLYDDNNYFSYKNKYRNENNLNDNMNRMNNFVNKNKFNYIFMSSKHENLKGNSYRDLNERISQLRKNTLNNNLINLFPSKNSTGKRTKLNVLPSNFK